MTSNPQDRIVATVFFDQFTTEVTKITAGAMKEAWEDIPESWGWLPITETMLLQMNSFMRKRWEKSAEDLGIRKKDYPTTPDECNPSV